MRARHRAASWALMLLFLLSCHGWGVQAQEGAESSSFDPTAIAPELGGESVPFPAEAVTALEDGNYSLARTLLMPLILQHPTALELRALKVQLEAAEQVDEFLVSASGNSPLSPHNLVHSPARDERDRQEQRVQLAQTFENIQQQLFRLTLERQFYRGDREDAQAFIDRHTAARQEILDALAALEPQLLSGAEDAAGRARIALSRAIVMNMARTLTPELRKTTWQRLEEAGSWSNYFCLVALELGVSDPEPAQSWLHKSLEIWRIQREEPPQSPSQKAALELLFGRALLLSLTQEVRSQGLAHDEAADFLRKEGAVLAGGPWADDLEYQVGLSLSRAFRPSGQEEGVRVLRAVAEGPWRNISYSAALELCNLLRRLRRYPEVVAVAESWHRRFPTSRYRLDRELGRAHYQLEHYSEAAEIFRTVLEGPRGKGGDYLLLAETLRWLDKEGTLLEAPDGAVRDLRKEGLQLVDFAQKSMVEEARVVGWVSGQAPPLIALYARLAEVTALSRHAQLFPATFAFLGLKLFLEGLAALLGVALFASFPRLSRRLWPRSLMLALWAVLLPALALSPIAPGGLDGMGQLAWIGQAATRIFLVASAAALLSHMAGLPSLELRRLWLRLRQKSGLAGGNADARARLLEAGGVLVVLLMCQALSDRQGGGPVPYLERFSRGLVGAELGALFQVTGQSLGTLPGAWMGLATLGGLAFYVLLLELLTRGVILAGTVRLLKGLVLRLPHDSWLTAVQIPAAIAVSAMTSSVLRLGGVEPVGVQALTGVLGGLVLGVLRVRSGLDVSCGVAVLAAVLGGIHALD